MMGPDMPPRSSVKNQLTMLRAKTKMATERTPEDSNLLVGVMLPWSSAAAAVRSTCGTELTAESPLGELRAGPRTRAFATMVALRALGACRGVATRAATLTHVHSIRFYGAANQVR